MEHTQKYTLFISSSKQQLGQLYKFLISEHFDVSQPEKINTASATILYGISTTNTHQRGLRATAIQYVENNFLNGILMFDRTGDLKQVCTRKNLELNK